MKSNTGSASLLLPWVFPAIIALGALSIFVSGRDLTQLFLTLESVAETTRNPIAVWLQRGVSLLLLIASAEVVARHFAQKRPAPSVTLLVGFVLYWFGTVGIPAVFAANPMISHEYLYSLVLGIAICLVGPVEQERLLRHGRDALFVLMLLGVLLVPFKTNMVMDTSYNQGLIRGLPRFGGLTPHPVTQGMLAQIALLLLWVKPYEKRWLNRASWALGLGVLYVAQSKTAWVAFVVCAMVLWLVRRGSSFTQRATDPRDNTVGVLACLGVIVGVLAIAGWILLGDAFGQAADFANSAEGAQLMSLTGRDRIWIAAIEEWQMNPTFGYGLSIWDAAYRTAIGMPNATHAHNQFLDDLARAGSVGATALVIYAVILLVLSVRSARASGGLSLALFVALALRSVSEVPLSLMGYGTELFTHLLLLATVAAASAQRQVQARPASSLRFGVAS